MMNPSKNRAEFSAAFIMDSIYVDSSKFRSRNSILSAD
nr:MAG TPA: hypothetical protein [Caudoviricetes sp.]